MAQKEDGKGPSISGSDPDLTRGTESEAMATPEEEEDSEPWFPGLGAKLGNGGLIAVLFEAPTGFAIFTYDGVNLYLPSAIENIWADFYWDDRAKSVAWLEKFETFDDKASAINAETGVSNRLAAMIRDVFVPGQKLAVGNFEYKQIIEKELQIPCLFDKVAMELMWGLKNCMKALLPGAPEPTKEDCLHMSEGMNIVLRRYSLEVEPEMVNENIVEVAGIVYDCDYVVNKHSKSLRAIGDLLKKISDIDSQDWGLVKLASALIILCNCHGVLPPGDPLKVFTKDEYLKLQSHGPLYEGKIFKASLKAIYQDMLWARCNGKRMVTDLRHYVREARKEYEAGQASMKAKKRTDRFNNQHCTRSDTSMIFPRARGQLTPAMPSRRQNGRVAIRVGRAGRGKSLARQFKSSPARAPVA